jgi:hypothetical protein
MKAIYKVSGFTMILVLSLVTIGFAALNSNASHIANCATSMGGQHVAACAQSMDRGVSGCATMKPCHNS